MYKPDLIKAKSWENVVDFYAAFALVNLQHEPMHLLVSQIAVSDYAQDLFPATSMHTLLISQVAEFERRHEILEINFNGVDQQFHFQYWEHPNVKKRWMKVSNASEGFSTFERFLKLKKWFT